MLPVQTTDGVLAMNDRNEHGAMSPKLDPHVDSGLPMAYQVRIAGQLGSRWADWFEGLAITLDGGDTLITGPVIDQAALQGLLKRVRDLGTPLISVTPIEGGAARDVTARRRGNAPVPNRKDREDR
jgi:hypothetical protein